MCVLESLGVSLHDAGVEVSAIPKQYQFGADVTTQVCSTGRNFNDAVKNILSNAINCYIFMDYVNVRFLLCR